MICTTIDQFIEDYIESTPCWTATLNTGVTVYMDDNRPGIIPTSAWERLYNYCSTTNNYIVDMTIQFRKNRHQLKSNADGYYFSKGVRGSFALPKTLQLFFVGTLFNNELLVTCWKVPEMMEETTEKRDIMKAGKCLIKRNIHLSTALVV